MKISPGIKSYVLVTNHQSFFDTFAIAGFMPGDPRFVAKKELLKIPIVGFAMQRGGHILIDRDSGGKAIRKAIQIIRSGLDVCVYRRGPSVQRWPRARVRRRRGVARDPVKAAGGADVDKRAQAASIPRGAIFVTPGLTMRMRIGKPIPTEDMRSSDRTELTQKLEEAVRASFTTEV